MRIKEKMSLWNATRTLWIKYCGIADEYKMLRDRWLYLHNKKSLATLPNLKKSTFAKLDKLVRSLSKKFRALGFYRDRMENFERYGKLLRDMRDITFHSLAYTKIKEMFFDLASYEGLLKLAFFQRTVSSEISHVASGMPRSPERTIGNELFYLAADKVAQKYNACIKISRSQWDEFITFAPPKEAEMFYGALFRSSRHLTLFHVLMSEEQKYFVGSYLALAHEFAHAAINDNRGISGALEQIAIRAAIKTQKCRKCKIAPIVSVKINLYRGFFEEFLADLIATHIGGLNTVEALFDEILFPPSYTSIIRIRGILSYLNQIKLITPLKKRLELRFKNMMKSNQEFLNLIKRKDICTNCFLKTGKLWGKLMGELDQECQKRSGKSIFTLFVKENMFFNIDKKTENRIIKSIFNGIPCPQEDPRYILHAYHEAFKRSKGEKRPNYAATIHSLAFNEFS